MIRCAHVGQDGIRLFDWSHPEYVALSVANGSGERQKGWHLCDMEGHVNGYGMNLDGWCYLPFRRLEHLGPEAAFAAAVSRFLAGEGATQ